MPEIQNIPTTQYIGPRIIPHLWDPILWDASTQYDALAVVQYEGAPYIARYVPPQGTLPTDTTYWVRWADFNAQMAQLQQTVESYDDRITESAESIAEIDASLTTETQARMSADENILAQVRTKVQGFGTVADMQAAELTDGTIAHTDGFHASGDGGAAFYEIRTDGTANGMDVIALDNGLVAVLVADGDTANILQYGADRTGANDAASIINYVTQTKAAYVPIGTYLVGSTIAPQHSILGESYARQPGTDNASMLKSGMTSGAILDVSVDSDIQVRDLAIMCNGTEDAIHYAINATRGKITHDNVGIFNLRGTGIKVEQGSGFSSRGVFITNTAIWGASDYPSSQGIYLDSLNGDNRLDNIEIMGTKFGIRFVSGIYYGGNIHIWNGCLAGSDNGSWWHATRAIDLSYGPRLYLSNLYLDTTHMMFNNLHVAGYDTTYVEVSNFTYVEDSSNNNVTEEDGALLYSSGGHPRIVIDNALLKSGPDYKTRTFRNVNVVIKNGGVDSTLPFTQDNAKALYPGNNTNKPCYVITEQTVATSDNYIEFARCRLGDASGICNLFIGDLGGTKNTEVHITRRYSGNIITVTTEALNGTTADDVYYKIENGILRLFFKHGAVASTQYRMVQTLLNSWGIVPFEYGLAVRQSINYDNLHDASELTQATAQ